MGTRREYRLFGATTRTGTALIATYDRRSPKSPSARETVADCFWTHGAELPADLGAVRVVTACPTESDLNDWRPRVESAAIEHVNCAFWKRDPLAVTPFEMPGEGESSPPEMGTGDLIRLAWAHPEFARQVAARTKAPGLGAAIEDATEFAKRIVASRIGPDGREL